MKKHFTKAIPFIPGETQQFKKFTSELNWARKNEFIKSRKKFGIRERTFYQTTPHGNFVIITLEEENPENAFVNFSRTYDEFPKWFIKEVNEIQGLDLTTHPKRLLPEFIVESKEEIFHVS